MSTTKSISDTRYDSLRRSLRDKRAGGITAYTARLMATPLGGSPTDCTLRGYCRTFVFDFPYVYSNSEGHIGHQVLYTSDNLRAAVVSDLPVYFEAERDGFLHYSIDVSLRAGVSREYRNANDQASVNGRPLFLVIEEYVGFTATMLKNGQCFTIDERRDGEAIIEGGREGARALLAIRTVDGEWPDFREDMHIVNIVLAAVKSERGITGHIREIYRAGCFVNVKNEAVYAMAPSLSATGSLGPRPIDRREIEDKSARIGTMLGAMIADKDPVASELFDSIVMDKTRDDGYLRLWYLRLWQAAEDASAYLGRPQFGNGNDIVAGDRTLKELKNYRNWIAHWHTGTIDFSHLKDLQLTVIELVRRKYGERKDH